MIITKEIFKEYIKTKNTTYKKANGFYIQNLNNFIICIKSEFYNSFKKHLINRNIQIIEEENKTINKETKEQRNYLLIDSLTISKRKSIKAILKKYNLTYRKIRVLDPQYREKDKLRKRKQNKTKI